MAEKSTEHALKLSALAELRENLYDLSEVAERLTAVLHGMQSEYLADDRYRELQDELGQTTFAAQSFKLTGASLYRQLLELQFNNEIYKSIGDGTLVDSTIDAKREIASEINAYTRGLNFALRGDNSKCGFRPQIIVVVTSRDKKGRYAFEDRETKKRTSSYPSIKDVLPLKFQEDLPRRGPTDPQSKHLGDTTQEPRKKKSG